MKINIIGAGVAGLSAGCYLQMHGFDTTIFEKHTSPGGLCTSWERNGYTFESGLQWLLGSGDCNPFFQLWSELIDMESIRFIHHDIRIAIEVKDTRDIYGVTMFHLYSNLDKLERYLLRIAPEDKTILKKWIRTIHKIQTYEIPPLIREVPQLMSWHQKIKYIRHLPLLIFLHKIKRETNFTLAGKLTNPFLKEAFRLLYDGEQLPMMITTLPMAFNDLEGTGYPVGGSRTLVGKLEQKYRDLGGNLRCRCGVEKIVLSDDRATGVVLTSGETISSEVTISGADWHFTLNEALGGKYLNKQLIDLQQRQELKIYYSLFMVSLGVTATFENQPHFMRFPMAAPITSPDGTRYERMELHIRNYDPTAAPAGKTVVTISFYTLNADFWINLRREDPVAYQAEKNHFGQRIIEQAIQKLTGLKNNIEVTDIATPATYHRYTNNWKGSVQGWLPGKNLLARSPVKPELAGLKDFYFIGHWTIPGGGLPVAIKSARDVAQIICKRNHVPFMAGR
jgi:phytoene dehydrogenase-like protein